MCPPVARLGAPGSDVTAVCAGSEVARALRQARREQHWQEYAERRARLEAREEAKRRAIILRDQARHERVADRKKGPILLEYQMGDPFQI